MKRTKRCLAAAAVIGGAFINSGVGTALGTGLPGAPKLQTLYRFRGVNDPPDSLAFYGGALYGTTYLDGAYGAGTVFQLTPPSSSGGAWTKTVLYEFKGGSDGALPEAAVVLGADGAIYGTTSQGGLSNAACGGGVAGFSGCGVVYRLAPPSKPGHAWTETPIYSFQGSPDGFRPASTVVFDGNGALYGGTPYGGSAGFGTVFQLTPPASGSGAWSESILYSFASNADGQICDGVVVAHNGVVYGTTNIGGTSNSGTAFQLTPPGTAGGAWSKSTLYTFAGGSDGLFPGNLTIGAEGVLYGATNNGGMTTASCQSGCGTVFQLEPPAAPGGAWAKTILHTFAGTGDGALPENVILDAKGVIYGAASEGGSQGGGCFAAGCGAIYQIAPPTMPGGAWTESVLYSVSSLSPGSVVFDGSGDLLGPGVASVAGSQQTGVVFQLTPPASPGGSWTESNIYDISQTNDGSYPQGPVLVTSQGTIYGVTLDGGTQCYPYGCGIAFQLSPPTGKSKAWKEAIIHSFTNAEALNVNGGLIADSQGALYGAAPNGGSSACTDGCGTVFQLVPPADPGGAWSENTIYQFVGTDGDSPEALAIDSNGVLYGVEAQGGTSGFGTVFQLTPPSGPGGSWTKADLYDFQGGKDGEIPIGLAFSNGALYGVTATTRRTRGTAFQLAPPAVAGGAWTKTTLHLFRGGKDGADATGYLAFDSSGAVYGATAAGGSTTACRAKGCGTVFQLTPPAAPGGAWSEKILYRFKGGSQGSSPINVAFLNGDLVGATSKGGTSTACGKSGCGTLFELSPDSTGGWSRQTLQNFSGADGENLRAVTVNDGVVYGAAGTGTGTLGNGSVFELTF